MKLIFKYFSPYKWIALWGLVIKVIGTLCDLVIPYILAHIIDVVVYHNSTKEIVLWGILMMVVSLIGFLGNSYANHRASYTAKMTTKGIRRDLFLKIEELSEEQKDQITLPSLVGRMTTDTYNTHQMTNMMQRLGVRAPILLIGGIIVCLCTDPILTLAMLAILPFILLAIILLSKKGVPLFNDLQLSNDELVQNVRENVTGARIIKALAKEDSEAQRFDEINQNVCKKNRHANILISGLNPLITILLNIGLISIIVIGAYRCNQGLCTKGTIVSFTSYFAIISTAMLNVTRLFIVYSKSLASAKRIQEILDMNSSLEVETTLDSSSHFLEFRNVSFSYLKQHNNLQDMNFYLEENQSLGIIGATGSGKTTILNLLMRFYDPDQGNIYFNYQNVKNYTPEDLRSHFGVVFQNDLLFNETIYENIRFGRSFSKEDCIEALKKAQAYDFVSKLEKGIDTNLSAKGSNLSGGQKQRLLIARAIVGNPQMILLDDSSSALDYKTDANLRKELYKNYQNIIIIAQRISSIKDCDKIIVLDRGKIVGIGTHEELLKNCKIYKEIAYSQMGVGDAS